VISEAHDCVTVLFSDIVGYTSMSTSVNTADVFDMLNRLYTAFDALSDKHGVYKVDTIGDGASPLPPVPLVCSHQFFVLFSSLHSAHAVVAAVKAT
jgi:class 3 adenylate cyclase